MDWSPPGSSVHGISHTRILEWVAIPFSRESSWFLPLSYREALNFLTFPSGELSLFTNSLSRSIVSYGLSLASQTDPYSCWPVLSSCLLNLGMTKRHPTYFYSKLPPDLHSFKPYQLWTDNATRKCKQYSVVTKDKLKVSPQGKRGRWENSYI